MNELSRTGGPIPEPRTPIDSGDTSEALPHAPVMPSRCDLAEHKADISDLLA